MVSNLKNKKVLVMGLGLIGGGVETVKWLVKHGARVLVTDLKNEKELRLSLKKLKGLPAEYRLGKHLKFDFSTGAGKWSPDLIIKNPGVPNDSPFLKIAKKNKIPIETDIGLFFKLWPASTHLSRRGGPGQIIGVTGTKGKSTTATLIGRIFKEAGVKSSVAGNIGQSPLKYLPKTRINADRDADQRRYIGVNQRNNQRESAIIILELSSWQLESLVQNKISPQIAVITNIYPDHLNRYKNLSEYLEAKKNIFKYQKPDDFVILNYDNKATRQLGKETKSRVFWFSKKYLNKQNGVFIKKNKVYFQNQQQKLYICSTNDIKLKGEHNLENVLAAVIVACLFQIKPKIIKLALRKFSGLPNRLELVRIFENIKYYNDTTATTPEATTAALKTLTRKPHTLDKKIILLAGGADKKLKFGELANLIKKTCRVVILFKGTASPKLKKELFRINYRSIIEVESMKEAIEKISRLAEKRDLVLLSPACASFGLFKNEFDRGKQFKDIVRNL